MTDATYNAMRVRLDRLARLVLRHRRHKRMADRLAAYEEAEDALRWLKEVDGWRRDVSVEEED